MSLFVSPARALFRSSFRSLHASCRLLVPSEGEERIAAKLRTALQAEEVNVEDQSGKSSLSSESCLDFPGLLDAGGCGAQYAVAVVSERFRGLKLVQQQRLVNDVLKVPHTRSKSSPAG